MKTKYIGIDIGKKKCFVCIVDHKGTILRETSFLNTVQDITDFVKSLDKGLYSATCESTGNMWVKTFSIFEQYGIPIVLANPFKTRAIAEARIKTDKLDARILANLLRADLIPACHVPPMEIRQQKEVLRRRIGLVRARTKVSNKLSSLLDRHDVVLDTAQVRSKKNIKKLESYSLDSVYDTEIMQQSVRHIKYLNGEISGIEDLIRDIASENKHAKLLMSITGFDVFSALLICLEIDNISRFGSSKQLVSWMGLCPTVYQSGNTTRHGKMRRDVNSHVKWIMMEAAGTAAKHDPRMNSVFEISRRSHPYMVSVSKVANKLARIIWFMLRDEKPYAQRRHKLYEKKLKRLK